MNNLRAARTADPRKLTQKDLALFLGVDRTTYSKYETGDSEPTFDTLCRLADYFSVSVEYLMGRSSTKKSPTLQSVSESKEAQELRETMDALSPEDRRRVLEFSRNLAATSQKTPPRK